MPILQDIINGEFDDYLDDIPEAVMNRKKILASRVFDTLQNEDLVRIVNCRPRYLIGAVGVLKEKRITKVIVEFPESMVIDGVDHDPYRKYAGSRLIVPSTMIEKVEDAD